jgi:para-nitrobenzyl esterase
VKAFGIAIRHPRRRLIALWAAGLAAAIGMAVATALPSARATTAEAPSCAAGTTVETATGPVCGIVANGATEWLGIPYAAPPVGPLRWEPTQPHAPWTTTLPAVQAGSECPQAGVTPVSENCLSLNVIVPPHPNGRRLPVMVWIHGGGFQSGAGSLYDQTRLAEAGNVIFVSLNYRLGVLGFLAEAAFGRHAGDYGLQDQQAALRWVRRNIGAFDGNAGNTTIFGESAGGSSVCDQLASPTAAGLFNKAISQSGEYNAVLGVPTSLQPQDCKAILPTERQAQAAGAAFASKLGCGEATDVAACLRGVPASTLLATSGGTNSPIINGTTLTLQLQRAFATGRFNRAKAILGTLRDENLIATPTTPAEYVATVRAQYGQFASTVLAAYPLRRYATPYIAFRTVAADSDTVCPALRTDQKLAKWTTVYGYEIDDTDAPPLGSTYPNPSLPNGAYHGADIALLFPGISLFPGSTAAPLDVNQQVLSDQMTAEWTAFARTGNPTTSGTPVWPPFAEAARMIMSLQPSGDSQVETASELSAVHNCAIWNRLPYPGK